MIIVPTDTPGVNILRDVPTMGEPDHRTGEPGGHAEILYDDVRVPFENIVGGETASARASRSPRSGSAPAASTTRCAGSASRSGPSTCCASGR